MKITTRPIGPVAYSFIETRRHAGEISTGLLYLDETADEMHALSGTSSQPLAQMDYDKLNPGADALAKLQNRWR